MREQDTVNRARVVGSVIGVAVILGGRCVEALGALIPHLTRRWHPRRRASGSTPEERRARAGSGNLGSMELTRRCCRLGHGSDSLKRREKAEFARACLAWPERKGVGGEGRVDAIGSLQCHRTRIFDWGNQCRWKPHRQRFEPIHQRICQWPWSQRLPQ